MKTRLALVALAFAPLAAIAAEALDVAVVVKSKESEYWNVVRAGAEKAKEDLAADGVVVNVIWDGPEREDQYAEQKRMVADQVERKVDAIVLAPSHGQALSPELEKAKTAGVPVVIIDSLAGSDVPVATVATNNYRAGMLAARQLAEAIGGKGNVALFRFLKGQGSSQPRETGFLDALRKYPGIQVVSSDVYAGATAEEGRVNGAKLLEQFGSDLQGVFAPNLYSTEGMLAALRDKGLAGGVAFVGFDSTAELVAALRNDEVAAVIVQQPFLMGYAGVKTAVAAARGEPVSKEVDTEVKIVTKANLDTPEVQKLLNP